MNTAKRLSMCLPFLGLALFIPGSSLAQSPFDGAWRINLEQSKLAQKHLAISVNKGVYDCFSCSPAIHIKADGTKQPLSGQGDVTITVREINPRSVAFVAYVGDTEVTEYTRTVSNGGKTLTEKGSERQGGQPVTFEETFTRVEKAAAGANRISGSWRRDKAKAGEGGLMTTYTTAGDELTMSRPTGESYAAKLDGKAYPVKGSYEFNAVSLNRVDERTIEETVKLNGKVIGVSRMTVARNGKKMTMVMTSMKDGATSTFIAEKQ